MIFDPKIFEDLMRSNLLIYLVGGISFTSNKKRKRREYANILNMGRHVFDTIYIWSVQVTKNILKDSGQSILGML